MEQGTSPEIPEQNQTPVPQNEPEASKPAGYAFDVSKFIIPVSILLGSIIIAGALIYTKTPAQNQVAAVNNGTQQQAANADIKNVNTTNEPFIGNPKAPVTIAYWSDYQCPFCKQFETTTLQNILTNYVNTGKVKIVFKDFQFLGPDSGTAALYARAIWDLYPNQYFAWREAMYKAQDKENSGFGDVTSIQNLTKTISGIDITKVNQAIAQKKDQYQKLIDADLQEGSQFGIQGTPAFIIGTTLIPGALPYQNFQQLIDTELKK